MLNLREEVYGLLIEWNLQYLNCVIVAFSVGPECDPEVLAPIIGKAEPVESALAFVGEEGAFGFFAVLAAGKGVGVALGL